MYKFNNKSNRRKNTANLSLYRLETSTFANVDWIYKHGDSYLVGLSHNTILSWLANH